MTTITGQLNAWLTEYSDPEKISGGDSAEALKTLSYIDPGADMRTFGYAFVGVATVSVEVPDMSFLIDNKVTALRKQQKNVRAEAEVKAVELERKINTLLAITNGAAK